ncbi:MAG: nucleotidyltransferase [Acidobacteriaceae bacterium]
MNLPPMDRDLKDLLYALNNHHVKYLVIGGYAVGVHAQPRVTKDLDVFIESSPENALAVYKALAEFGAPLSEFSVEDFHNPNVFAQFGQPPYRVDILQQISGVDFATAHKNSEELMVEGELPVRYISSDDLIANKLASGRLQDLADVEAIRQARAAKEH